MVDLHGGIHLIHEEIIYVGPPSTNPCRPRGDHLFWILMEESLPPLRQSFMLDPHGGILVA